MTGLLHLYSCDLIFGKSFRETDHFQDFMPISTKNGLIFDRISLEKYRISLFSKDLMFVKTRFSELNKHYIRLYNFQSPLQRRKFARKPRFEFWGYSYVSFWTFFHENMGSYLQIVLADDSLVENQDILSEEGHRIR